MLKEITATMALTSLDYDVSAGIDRYINNGVYSLDE